MKVKFLFLYLILLLFGSSVIQAQPRPSQLWQDTSLLYQSWDTALDTTSYTVAEKIRQKQINERLGHEWVLSYYPLRDAQEFGNLNSTLSPQERHIDFEDITPYTWKWVLLRTLEGRIHLRRPNWWLTLHQVEQGKPLALSIPEMQLDVVGQIEQILPNLLDSRFSPAPRDGDYAWLPITAWMERMAPEIWSYAFSSGDTIKATPNHPVFSKSRNRFVTIGTLSFGEEVLTEETIEVVNLIAKDRWYGEQVVNNLEVWRGHSFSVSGKNIVVHNKCTVVSEEDKDKPCPVVFLKLPDGTTNFRQKRTDEFEALKESLPKIEGPTSVVYLREIRHKKANDRWPKFGTTKWGGTSPIRGYFTRYEYGHAIEGNPGEDLRALIVVPEDYAKGIEKILGDLNIDRYGDKSINKTNGGIILRDVDHGINIDPDELKKMETWLNKNYRDWRTIFDISAHEWKNYVFKDLKKK